MGRRRYSSALDVDDFAEFYDAFSDEIEVHDILDLNVCILDAGCTCKCCQNERCSCLNADCFISCNGIETFREEKARYEEEKKKQHEERERIRKEEAEKYEIARQEAPLRTNEAIILIQQNRFVDFAKYYIKYFISLDIDSINHMFWKNITLEGLVAVAELGVRICRPYNYFPGWTNSYFKFFASKENTDEGWWNIVDVFFYRISAPEIKKFTEIFIFAVKTKNLSFISALLSEIYSFGTTWFDLFRKYVLKHTGINFYGTGKKEYRYYGSLAEEDEEKVLRMTMRKLGIYVTPCYSHNYSDDEDEDDEPGSFYDEENEAARFKVHPEMLYSDKLRANKRVKVSHVPVKKTRSKKGANKRDEFSTGNFDWQKYYLDEIAAF